MSNSESTETSVPEVAVEALANALWDELDLTIRKVPEDEEAFVAAVRNALAAALPHLAPSDAERERVIEGLREIHRRLSAYYVPQNQMFRAIDAAIALLRTPSPLPHVETGGEPNLRKLVPGFRLDWSGLRDRFEEDALRLEKLTTYEGRAAYLDEMARQFEDAIVAALRAPVEAAPAGVRIKKVYLAARYSRAGELRHYRKELVSAGFEVTSRWIDGGHELTKDGSVQAHEADRQRFATEDGSDCMASDIVISFTEVPRETTTRGGRHVEFGMAVAMGKRVLVVGHRENVFHCLPQVEFFANFADALAVLSAIEAQPSPLSRDDVLEEAATAALDQRCERGTAWDIACVTTARRIRALKGKP